MKNIQVYWISFLINSNIKFCCFNQHPVPRCSTLGLVMGLGILYPNWFFFFQCYAVLDIASHWLHLTASHYSGKAVTCLIIEYHVISLAINTWLLVKYHDVVSCVKKRILFSNNNINTSRSALQIVACPNSQRYIQEGFWEKYPLMWSIAPTPPP